MHSLDINAASSCIMKLTIKNHSNQKGKIMIDINKVCKRYGITSRTLRFYEEKGLIQSQKSSASGRRQYTEDDLRTLQSILTLRALSLPIKEIQECLKDGKPLEEILRFREKELEAAIHGKYEEIRLLQKALAALEEGKDMLGTVWNLSDLEADLPNDKREDLDASMATKHLTTLLDAHELDYKKTAKACANYILKNDYEKLSTFFSPKMQAYLPKEVFTSAREDLLMGAGKFHRYGKTWADPSQENILYQVLHFEKINIQIKFVFHGERIYGLWFEYITN